MTAQGASPQVWRVGVASVVFVTRHQHIAFAEADTVAPDFMAAISARVPVATACCYGCSPVSSFMGRDRAVRLPFVQYVRVGFLITH